MFHRSFAIALYFYSSVLFALDCRPYQQQCATLDKYPIHLSFDDGPADTTAHILDVLKKENIKATFFVIANKIDCPVYQKACQAGKQQACQDEQLCQSNRQILQRVKDEGHMIGSHSYYHVHHSKLSATQLQQHIQRSKTVLAPYFTTNPPLFRLPYGDGWFNLQTQPQVLQELKRQGFKHIAWEMSAYDWRVADQQGDKILQTAMNEICTKKRGTILFHDGLHDQLHTGRLFTAQHLDQWLPAMKCVAEFKSLQEIQAIVKPKIQ